MAYNYPSQQPPPYPTTNQYPYQPSAPQMYPNHAPPPYNQPINFPYDQQVNAQYNQPMSSQYNSSTQPMDYTYTQPYSQPQVVYVQAPPPQQQVVMIRQNQERPIYCGFSKSCCVVTWVILIIIIVILIILSVLWQTGVFGSKKRAVGSSEGERERYVKQPGTGPVNGKALTCHATNQENTTRVCENPQSVCGISWHPDGTIKAQGCSRAQDNWRGCYYPGPKKALRSCQCGTDLCNSNAQCVCDQTQTGHGLALQSSLWLLPFSLLQFLYSSQLTLFLSQ